MPYDPRPVGPGVTPDGTRESLPVQVLGGRGEPDRLYILGFPHNGIVEVREIVGGCAPREFAENADTLRQLFERAYKDRRLRTELYLIRNWLEGRA
jgi:hypothetical protein